jgi:4-hydroxybenzoate polyprenyltransferase
MTIRLIAGIVFFCAAIAGFTFANMLVDRMFDEIHRSNDGRWNYSELGNWARKDFFIVSEYRRLFPRGKLFARWRVTIFLAVTALAVVGVCLMTAFLK